MSKLDQDRHLKQLALRFCLAKGMYPCLEVVVSSATDLSDSVEVLTDLDVLGLEFVLDGGFRRTVFDCKSGKMSAINRAFWASGVVNYTGCDEAVALLKTRAVDNHRMSALKMGVDLHDETSFRDLGKTYDQAFDQDLYYQSSIDRWFEVYDTYKSQPWSQVLFELGRNAAPLSRQPWSIFRKILSELRSTRGNFDPARDKHLSIYFDVLSALFVLWSPMGKDVRRFYQPTMRKDEFETILRYYIWGGKESYGIRKELWLRDGEDKQRVYDLPAWDKLIAFAGIIISAPQELFGCVGICQALSIKLTCGSSLVHDAAVKADFTSNKRARQFILSLNDFVVAACGLPKDTAHRAEAIIGEF